MFGLFKGNDNDANKIYSPIKGKCIELEAVEDEVFSSGMMGNGIAIVPQEGKVYSPCDGEITAIFPTGHAVGLTSSDGIEILIHVGIDTVKMNGRGFSLKAEEGQRVKRGDLLLEFDIDEIKKAGYPLTTPVIITNSDEYPAMKFAETGDKAVGDVIITL